MNPSAIIANDIADLADRLTDDLLRRHSDIIRAGEKIRQMNEQESQEREVRDD